MLSSNLDLGLPSGYFPSFLSTKTLHGIFFSPHTPPISPYTNQNINLSNNVFVNQLYIKYKIVTKNK
jgi:hypothetical protein